MRMDKLFLVLFVIFIILCNLTFVHATLNAFNVVGEPQCYNEGNFNYVQVDLKNDYTLDVDTKSISVFQMENGAVYSGDSGVNGEWSEEIWSPGEVITFKTAPFMPGSVRSQATDFGLEWLNSEAPSSGLSGFFSNPCLENIGGNVVSAGDNSKEPIHCWQHQSDGICIERIYDFSYGTYPDCPMGYYGGPNGKSECEARLCGNNICSSYENCNSCPQDCGCNQNDECFEDNNLNMGYICMPIINIKELENPKEINLVMVQGNVRILPGVIIKDKEKNYSLFFSRPISTDGGYGDVVSVINPLFNEGVPNLRIGENVSTKMGENELNINLLGYGDNEIKLLLYNQSNFILNKQYFYYGGIVLLAVIIFVSGFFYISKRKKNGPFEHSTLNPKKDSSEKSIMETEKIPNSITEAISITGLNVKRGSNAILSNINISIKRGDFVSLLGPSGSGKSTIIEILAGRKKQTSGNIKVFEKSLGEENVNHLIGFVPQGNEVYMNQTVLQNLENSVIKWGIKNSKEKIEDILEQVKLSERKNLVASKLSGGQLKLLSLAMELLREPELLILDEPTTGLDPNTRNQIITILSNLSRYDKKTVLITTHFMDDAEECDNVVIIDKKRIVAEGSPEKLKKMLSGSGKMVTLVLDNSDRNVLEKLRKTKGIERVIAEGRTFNILTENPNAVDIANKVHDYGGYVIESKISKATMKEVFVFFTGRNPEE